VDEGDPRGVGGARHERRAVEQDLAGIGADDAGQDLDQRRLAGPVLAEQRQNLAPVELEVDGVAGERAAEALGDPAKRQDRPGAARGCGGDRRLPALVRSTLPDRSREASEKRARSGGGRWVLGEPGRVGG
jgi:hypothetical protein